MSKDLYNNPMYLFMLSLSLSLLTIFNTKDQPVDGQSSSADSDSRITKLNDMLEFSSLKTW